MKEKRHTCTQCGKKRFESKMKKEKYYGSNWRKSHNANKLFYHWKCNSDCVRVTEETKTTS